MDSRTLEVCAGSVTGAWHLRAGRNNQDAHQVLVRPGYLVAVVCDGCSAARHSELGALLGARWLAATLGRALEGQAEPRAELEGLGEELVGFLVTLAGRLAGPGEDPASVARQHLLFTVVGAVVTPAGSWIFHQGDGLVTWNGEALDLGPRTEAPDYPGQRAVARLSGEPDPGGGFAVQGPRPTAELRQLLLATDGALPLAGAGELEGLVEGELPFRNPDGLRRRLARRLRQASPALPLDDDLTVVAIRQVGAAIFSGGVS